MAERLLLRFITGIEAVIYWPPSVVSGWFSDDPGYGAHDLLADRTETRRRATLDANE